MDPRGPVLSQALTLSPPQPPSAHPAPPGRHSPTPVPCLGPAPLHPLSGARGDPPRQGAGDCYGCCHRRLGGRCRFMRVSTLVVGRVRGPQPVLKEEIVFRACSQDGPSGSGGGNAGSEHAAGIAARVEALGGRALARCDPWSLQCEVRGQGGRPTARARLGWGRHSALACRVVVAVPGGGGVAGAGGVRRGQAEASARRRRKRGQGPRSRQSKGTSTIFLDRPLS
jgi:hypothetical protein